MEKDLERSRDFYLTLFEEFPALIWRAGVDAKCNYFNKKMAPIYRKNHGAGIR
ncbi:hypothetical protein [uncultured Methanobacterium sp.]|uniref:hypothetical protein n=1 Tax=uncultured Methanobacterium sp. TaxID=176306 RepID=UPI002AA7C084|nr:hypothetical protein [uncultured Methanobacterium sp.]